MNKELALAKEEIFIQKEYNKALQRLLSIDNKEQELIELIANCYFSLQEYEKAASMFSIIKKKYQEGYCHLALGNNNKAKNMWEKAPESPAAKWGLCLVDYVNFKISKLPTYFQIRNFFEKDLSLLIKAKQNDFAQNLISCSDTLVKINPETYKFTGKALYNNNMGYLAAQYFTKSHSLVDNDPEVLYFLGKYCLEEGSIKDAKILLNRALDLNYEYIPAKKLLKKIG